MRAQSTTYLTPEEYLTLERQVASRSEYLDGEMFAMGGASLQHNLIVSNLVRELSVSLKARPCQVFSNDLRVHIPKTGLSTYPDVVVVCGEPRLEDESLDTLLNPILIAEVLSASTEAYDRGKKFEHYRTIETLAEYLLIAQDGPRIEQYVRQSDGRWLFSAVASLEAILEIPTLQVGLSLAEVYDKVQAPPPSAPSSP